MYLLRITKIKYPKNDTNTYEYKTIDNLLGELKRFILDNKVTENDIIRIENVKSDYERFIDKQYNKMKEWIYKATDEELEEHYKWYNVEKGDRTDLLNIMFESYCNSYDDKELEERINDLLEV